MSHEEPNQRSKLTIADAEFVQMFRTILSRQNSLYIQGEKIMATVTQLETAVASLKTEVQQFLANPIPDAVVNDINSSTAALQAAATAPSTTTPTTTPTTATPTTTPAATSTPSTTATPAEPTK